MNDEIEHATPPVEMLLAHWRELTAKEQTIGGWGLDRAEAILGYIAELEARCEQLSSTIQWNRDRHAEQIAEHRARGRALTEMVREAVARNATP